MGKAKLAWFPCEPLCPLWLRRSLPQRAQGSQGKTKQNIELRNFAPTNPGHLVVFQGRTGLSARFAGARATHMRGYCAVSVKTAGLAAPVAVGLMGTVPRDEGSV